ncbi:MAG TPA: YdbH domain-containing protein, partial [Caulobacteraceae bacterium]
MNVVERTLQAAEGSPPPGVSRRAWRWASLADYGLEAAAVALMVVAAVGLSLYAGRRALVADLAEDYLERRGVEAEIQVYDVDSRGFVGRVRLGPASDPDFLAERVIVGLAAPPPPEGPYALRPRVIRVLRPQLKANWNGERLSFGSLDPLVREFLSKPPEPDKPSPLVLIEQGSLRLATPWGLVRAGGSGAMDNSKLRRLDLDVAPARLNGRGFAADLTDGALRISSDGARADVDARLSFRSLSQGDTRLGGGAITLTGASPYPDMEARSLRGPLRLNATLRSADARMGDARAPGLDAALRLNGDVAGPLDGLTFRGAATGSLDADHLRAGALALQAPAAQFRSAALVLALGRGGVEGTGGVTGTASARRFASGDLKAERLDARFDSGVLGFQFGGRGADVSGPVRVALTAGAASAGADLSANAVSADLRTNLQILKGASAPLEGHATAGTLRLLAADAPVTVSNARTEFAGRAGEGGFDLQAALRGDAALPAPAARRLVAQLPILADEPAYAGALTRAASRFTVAAPGVRLAQSRGRTSVALTAPARISGGGGVVAELRPVPGRPLWAGGQGGLQFALRGGGAPHIDARIERYALVRNGFDADLRVRAAVDLAIARGAVLQARGRAVSRGGVFEFRPAECVAFSADAVELGENDLAALSTRLCPLPGAVLLRASANGYRVRGRYEDTAVAVPFLETRLTNGAGVLDAAGGEAGLTAVSARVDAGEADDTAAVRRYHPVALTGTAALASGDWDADLVILDRPGGARLGTADLTHDQVSGVGRVLIAADDLTFAPEGLQPHDLTPLGVGAISKVEGSVDFAGEITWTAAKDGGTSRGRITTPGLSFDSPAGRVVGLGPELGLSSLTPLIAPPGQTVRAERVEAFAALENPEVRFGLTPTALQVEAATAGFAGGRVTLEPLTVPLVEGERTLRGAVQLDDVDIGRLIEASTFKDRVDFQAVVDGRVPFESGPDGLRFDNGELHSVRPGRLSIDREVLSGVQASGGEPEAVTAEGVPAPLPVPEAGAAAFQDLAYDALENLAYDDMQVSVDSRPGGRLGMIFKIDGEYDPAVAQQARISILDLIRGKA